MVRLFIDNREIESPAEACTVSQILRYIDNVHLNPDSVIRQIRVRGLPLIPGHGAGNGENAASPSMRETDKLEVLTGNIREIARGSISEALDYLARTESIIPYLAKSCRANATPESFADLRQLYEGFYLLSLLVDKLEADFKFNIEDIWAQKGFEPGYHRKLISTLKGLIESQGKGDLAGISGLLESEILALVSLWKEALSTVARQLSATPSSRVRQARVSGANPMTGTP